MPAAPVQLSDVQIQIVSAPTTERLFVSGPAGSGKSTAAAARLSHLLKAGVRGDRILVLTPQRSLQHAYKQAISSEDIPAGPQVTLATIGGIVRRTVELFWPLAASPAGFSDPTAPPIFLTSEAAQYHMAHLARPRLDRGALASITMDRNRMYAQLLDSLNKAAAVGFPYNNIGDRLSAAWSGDPAQHRVYADAQALVSEFRQFCLVHNLLDFSLQLDVFWNVLWPMPLVNQSLLQNYRHIIYDNVEEDIPRAHDLIRAILPSTESALLLMDDEAGYRSFLGADPASAGLLSDACDQTIRLDNSFVMSPQMQILSGALTSSSGNVPDPSGDTDSKADLQTSLSVLNARYYPELIEAIVHKIETLISGQSTDPNEIVIIAPYLSDSLRFAIGRQLDAAGLPWRTLRPSHALRNEPYARAALTLATLAHPSWAKPVPTADLAQTFMLVFDCDLLRAKLLAGVVLSSKDGKLADFGALRDTFRQRMGERVGTQYKRLQKWLEAYEETQFLQLDHFIRRLFGELLSQPGYALHDNMDGSTAIANLVESVYKFRTVFAGTGDLLPLRPEELGLAYIKMFEEGVLAGQYLEHGADLERHAVLVAPAFSFLMSNAVATHQFWFDAGSRGWYQRLDQPLTHAHVLSRQWKEEQKWELDNDESASSDTLRRMVLGLTRRCRETIHLGISALSETGYEQDGQLLKIVQHVLRSQKSAGVQQP